VAAYGLRRSCEECSAERGEPCRSRHKGGRAGQPIKGCHASRQRPADKLGAWQARRELLRSNERGTCLYCGRTVPNGGHFCSDECAKRFGVAAANNGHRLVERESKAAAILAGEEEE